MKHIALFICTIALAGCPSGSNMNGGSAGTTTSGSADMTAGASGMGGSPASGVTQGSGGKAATSTSTAGTGVSGGHSGNTGGSAGAQSSANAGSASTASDFDKAFQFPSGFCSAPKAEALGASGLDMRALTLTGDTLVIGTSTNIMTMPKAGGTAPVMLSDDAGYALAALDSVVYYSDAVFLGSQALPGTMGKQLVSKTDDIKSQFLATDANALYASGADSCADAVFVYALDGTKRSIKADCPNRVAVAGGNVFITSNKNSVKGVFKAGPTDTAFQPLVMDKRLDVDVPIVATAKYVYFSLSEVLTKSYLARVPIGGGATEVLGGAGYFDNIITDGKALYFYSSANTICTFRYTEATNTFDQVAAGGTPSAFDDQYVYLMGGKDGVSRIPR